MLEIAHISHRLLLNLKQDWASKQRQSCFHLDSFLTLIMLATLYKNVLSKTNLWICTEVLRGHALLLSWLFSRDPNITSHFPHDHDIIKSSFPVIIIYSTMNMFMDDGIHLIRGSLWLSISDWKFPHMRLKLEIRHMICTRNIRKARYFQAVQLCHGKTAF